MIDFSKCTLTNGLTVITHEDHATPFVVVNVTYNVGARDEQPDKTGFAHLFEHLMFSGSKHAPTFDRPLELAGATNNAFTNNDLTNYYELIPKENLETALWLESDRMAFLQLDEEGVEVQRKVVIEEFKERYLNQPYGETWHHLRELAYQKHPYQWPTIGKSIEHIQQASLENVRAFYERFYHPNNAILTLAGNIYHEEAVQLAEKWFGDLASGPAYHRQLPKEPEQTASRRKELTISAPADSLHMAFPMPGRGKEGYYACDLLSDVLGHGESGRLKQELVKRQQLFSSVDCFVTGSFEDGLFVIAGKTKATTTKEEAEQAIWEILDAITQHTLPEHEFLKLRNNIEASLTYQMIQPLYKAFQLAFFELMGDAEQVNQEFTRYRQLSAEQLQRVAQQLFRKEKANILWQFAHQSSTVKQEQS